MTLGPERSDLRQSVDELLSYLEDIAMTSPPPNPDSHGRLVTTLQHPMIAGMVLIPPTKQRSLPPVIVSFWATEREQGPVKVTGVVS